MVESTGTLALTFSPAVVVGHGLFAKGYAEMS
jgi:hypothetical protein